VDSSPEQQRGRVGGEKGVAGMKFVLRRAPRYIRRLLDECIATRQIYEPYVPQFQVHYSVSVLRKIVQLYFSLSNNIK
jgi:hypothetical protein